MHLFEASSGLAFLCLLGATQAFLADLLRRTPDDPYGPDPGYKNLRECQGINFTGPCVNHRVYPDGRCISREYRDGHSMQPDQTVVCRLFQQDDCEIRKAPLLNNVAGFRYPGSPDMSKDKAFQKVKMKSGPHSMWCAVPKNPNDPVGFAKTDGTSNALCSKFFSKDSWLCKHMTVYSDAAGGFDVDRDAHWDPKQAALDSGDPGYNHKGRTDPKIRLDNPQ